MAQLRIKTCYGCPYFYSIHGVFSAKHCGGNHLDCSYYNGTGNPDVGLARKDDKIEQSSSKETY